jgi:pimeloyl-ACP methyl ester carboxylesterase
MMKVCRGTFAAGALVGLGLLVPCNKLCAQQAQPDPVNITTVDGVSLHGSFYKSAKAKAPTVIVLHRIGDSAVNKKAYIALAEALQPEYSVMLFDFRGHGKSEDVAADFWKVPMNMKMIKGAKANKNSIEYADFQKGYYPALVNDIAAVKAYLDRCNDAGDCNTSNTILIGAEDGATLGAIWLNSQWSLNRMVANPANPFLLPVPSKDLEGKDVIACIWLSISSKLGDSMVKVDRTLDAAARVNATPSVFIYGDKDTAGKDLATAAAKHLKPQSKDLEKFVVPYKIEGGKLKGIELLQKGLPTEKLIVEFLGEVVDAKRREWTKRDFKTSEYRWRVNGSLQGHAKMGAMAPDPNNLMFNDYLSFIGR